MRVEVGMRSCRRKKIGARGGGSGLACMGLRAGVKII